MNSINSENSVNSVSRVQRGATSISDVIFCVKLGIWPYFLPSLENLWIITLFENDLSQERSQKWEATPPPSVFSCGVPFRNCFLKDISPSLLFAFLIRVPQIFPPHFFLISCPTLTLSIFHTATEVQHQTFSCFLIFNCYFELCAQDDRDINITLTFVHIFLKRIFLFTGREKLHKMSIWLQGDRSKIHVDNAQLGDAFSLWGFHYLDLYLVCKHSTEKNWPTRYLSGHIFSRCVRQQILYKLFVSQC